MAYPAKTALVTLVIMAGLSNTHGQTASDSTKAQKPTMVTERAKVAFLVGTYTTRTTMPAGPSMPNGATGTGMSVITWALDSMFLSLQEEGDNSLLGRYKGHGMLGFDKPTGQFVLAMFNNAGDRPVYRGNFSGDTLVLQTRVPAPKGGFDQKILWYKQGDAVKLDVLNDSGKGFHTVLEQTAIPAAHETK